MGVFIGLGEGGMVRLALHRKIGPVNLEDRIPRLEGSANREGQEFFGREVHDSFGVGFASKVWKV